MRGAKGEAVLPVPRTLRNKAAAAGSARPEGKNAFFLDMIWWERPGILIAQDKRYVGQELADKRRFYE
jgi:hypothetical protein